MREKCKLLRDSMHRTDIMDKSAAIAERLIGTDAYMQAEKVFSYVNYGSEVETISFIETAVKHGKKVAVPVMVDPRKNRMVFQQITDIKELNHVHYGIMEPEYNENAVLVPDKKTLVLLPGLAFDVYGYRLGYGGGYYDRYLAEYKTLANYGLAFEQQIVDRIMINGYDVRMDGVITEEKSYFWEV